MKPDSKPKDKTEEAQEDFPGYPLYPASEDIYSRAKKEDDIDPENISKNKEPNEITGEQWNEKDYDHEATGDDLDVPGSELDDQGEEMGLEDEENNYYSIGGDNHSDLEESNGDLLDE